MIIKNGNVFCDDGVFRKTDIQITDNIITGIGEFAAGDDFVDATGSYIIPGLVDIHTHGADGADFCDASVDAVDKIAKFLYKNGVTSFLGTSMSLSEETLTEVFITAAQRIGKVIPNQATLMGINMEGPFFNPEKRGAQNPKHITNPDFKIFTRLNDVCDRSIKYVAIAPELPGAIGFIKSAKNICTVSLGHSNANYNEATDAFRAGARSVTHIFNAMQPLHHRDPGIIGAAVNAGAYAELICDGIHVHPAAVKSAFKLIGEDKTCLISDAMRACGLPDGNYDLGGQAVIVSEGTAKLPNGILAGSVVKLIDCVRNAVKFGVPLETAIKAATINPAKCVGIDGLVGSITKGKRADLLTLDKNLNILRQRFTPHNKHSHRYR